MLSDMEKKRQQNAAKVMIELEAETETETDSFPDGYIVLYRTFSTGSDPDMDPCTETFPDGYCTHFRDRSPSQ